MSVVDAELARVALQDRSEAKPARRAAPRKFSTLGTIAIGAILPLAILLLWQIAAEQQWVSAVFLPLPSKTFWSFFDMIQRQDFEKDFLA
jgi:sulfonate transport system permease protein